MDGPDPSRCSSPNEDGRGVTRRSVLAAGSLAVAAITPTFGGSTGTIEPARNDRSFEPTRHGFGFYNWHVREGPYPGTRERALEDDWREPFERIFDRPLTELPAGLRERLAHHAHEALLEAVRTNGYCYGMVFAAQRYFERPETIPAGFDAASEITHPNAPRSSRGTPVLDEIIEYQTAQYVDLHAWLGRYGLFDASLIDYESQMADLLATIDGFGTAAITLFSEESTRSHQVLVYDYERHPDRTVLFAYNPNYVAEVYERFTYVIEVDTSGERPVPRPIDYGPKYDQFVHNEYDRAIRTRRDPSGPLTADAGSLYDRLFGATLFVGTDPVVETSVVDPAGRRLACTSGTDPLHYRYGASEGTYRITLTGRTSGEYALDVYAGGRYRDPLDGTIEGSITAGETRRYEVTIADGRATLGEGLLGTALLGTAGTGYAYRRRR